MDTTIRVADPAELIAYVPHRLGFRPEESIVLVSLRGEDGRVGLVARMSVDDVGDGGDHLLVRHLGSDGASRVVQIVYSDDGSGRPRARAATIARRVEALVGATVGPVDTWWVSGSGYGCLDCRHDDPCPPAGRSLVELESTEVGAHMVVAGSVVADSRAEAYDLPPVDAARRRAVRAAVQRARTRRARGEESWLRDGLASWRRAVEARDVGAVVPPAVVGRVACGLEDIRLRDAVLLHLVRGEMDLVDRTAAGAAGPDVTERTGAAIAAIVDPELGTPPDPMLLGPGREVLEEVAVACDGTARAAAATLLALVAWWEGDGGRAGERLREAATADSGYRLAVLLQSALDAGLAPGWLRATRR